VRADAAGAVTDVLGEPYLAETIDLPPDDEGAVVATLVSRAAAGPTTKAVLHLHGFADYFFQTAYAAWWTARGYDFYALDLRKYGRSLRPHQTPNFVTDLRDYHPEIDAAWQRVTERDGHTEVVVSAHSTGGLVVGLWAADRRPAALAGAVMNSPWLDLQGSAVLRVVGTPIIRQLGARQPMREIKRQVTGLYARSLHKDHEGEWDFDLLWKPIESFTVYAGWLRAIREGHTRMHRGLDLPCPVLVLSSGRSALPEEMGEEVHGADIVLDVAQIRRWATAYGPHVTYVAVDGARHDVVLSRDEPRARAYDAIGTWMTAWVDPPSPALREPGRTSLT
jgi:alpha-beta hydrolase superfamily lysophospholipase